MVMNAIYRNSRKQNKRSLKQTHNRNNRKRNHKQTSRLRPNTTYKHKKSDLKENQIKLNNKMPEEVPLNFSIGTIEKNQIIFDNLLNNQMPEKVPYGLTIEDIKIFIFGDKDYSEAFIKKGDAIIQIPSKIKYNPDENPHITDVNDLWSSCRNTFSNINKFQYLKKDDNFQINIQNIIKNRIEKPIVNSLPNLQDAFDPSIKEMKGGNPPYNSFLHLITSLLKLNNGISHGFTKHHVLDLMAVLSQKIRNVYVLLNSLNNQSIIMLLRRRIIDITDWVQIQPDDANFYNHFIQFISTTYNNNIIFENYGYNHWRHLTQARIRNPTTNTVSDTMLYGMQQLDSEPTSYKLNTNGNSISMMLWLISQEFTRHISLIRELDNRYTIHNNNYNQVEEIVWNFARDFCQDVRPNCEYINIPIQDYTSFDLWNAVLLLSYYPVGGIQIKTVIHCLAGRGRTGSVFLLYYLYTLFIQQSEANRLLFLTQDIPFATLKSGFTDFFPGDSNELFKIDKYYEYNLFIKRLNTIKMAIATYYQITFNIPEDTLHIRLYSHLSSPAYDIYLQIWQYSPYFISNNFEYYSWNKTKNLAEWTIQVNLGNYEM